MADFQICIIVPLNKWKCYDRFWIFVKFWSSEWNTENKMSELYFNEESDIFWGRYMCQWSLSLHRSSTISGWVWKEKRRVVVKAMRKKLSISTLQLPICYILEYEISISANADIAKTKREKQIVFVVEKWMQCLSYYITLYYRGVQGKHLAIQLLWASARLLVTRASLVYLVDEFFFLFLV